MSADTRYYLDGIMLPDATFISELTDLTPSPNTEEITGMSSGHVHPLFRGVRNQVADVPFSSPAVGQILAAIVAGGNNYLLDLSAGNTDLQYIQGQNLGVRYGRAVSQHEILRLPKAGLFWRSITARETEDASITCRLLALWDEANNPIVNVGTGTLSGTPAGTQFYTLGPVKLNSSWLTNELEWTLDSGATAEEGRSGGRPWPTYGGVRRLDQIATVRVHGKPWGNQDITGTQITELLLYLRRKDPDGHNEPDGSALHTKITASNGLVLAQTSTGGGEEPTSTTLRCLLRASSGTADVLSISTAAAIA